MQNVIVKVSAGVWIEMSSADVTNRKEYLLFLEVMFGLENTVSRNEFHGDPEK